MNKILLFLLIALGLTIITVTPSIQVYAFDPFNTVCDEQTVDSAVCNPSPSENPISGNNSVLARILNILSFAVGVAAVIMVIIGGLKYITSNGDANSMSAAKNTILYAIIGAVVFLLSQSIVIFVLNKV